jgi:hypothetical protein
MAGTLKQITRLARARDEVQVAVVDLMEIEILNTADAIWIPSSTSSRHMKDINKKQRTEILTPEFCFALYTTDVPIDNDEDGIAA